MTLGATAGPPAIPTELAGAIAGLAATPRLLVCCDYDGTLAPIVADPGAAAPLDGTIEVLAAAAALPSTTVVLLSGRSRAGLSGLVGAPPGVRLVGSHGLEVDVDGGEPLSGGERDLLDRIRLGVEAAVAGVPGVRVEAKPAGLAVHVRQCAPADADLVLAAVANGPGSWPHVHSLGGKKVVELSVRPLGKGAALTRLRADAGATGTLMVGDDVTDEDAFAVLADAGSAVDVSVKVGPGETRAVHRVAGPEQVLVMLRHLVANRARGPLQARDAAAPGE